MAQSTTLAAAAHKKIEKERMDLMNKARVEVEKEWEHKFNQDALRIANDRRLHEDHMAAVRRVEAENKNKKVDDTLDRIIGATKRGRGRPKGSRNKPKPELVTPMQIGHIPDDDLIIPR